MAADLAALTAQIGAHLPGCALRAATLAEPGALARATAGAAAGLIYPMFMAEGWFTKSAIPARLAEVGAEVGANRWQIAPPFGTASEVQDLAVEIAQASGAARVLLAAHGSFRSAAPKALADAVAVTITARSQLPCAAAFIDQSPRLAQSHGYGRDSICLPFFAMRGDHLRKDIPEALAQAGFAGRLLPALGEHPQVPALVAGIIAQSLGSG